MKKISKILGLLLALSVLALGLVSCKDDTSKNSSNGSSAVIDEEVIYSSQVKTALILGEGVDESDVSSIRTAYYKQVGAEITVSGAASSYTHEIIVGKTDRALSEKAYRLLTLIKSDDSDVGYVIYSDGRSVAIAFDEAVWGETVAFSEAIECFVSMYMQTESLKLSSGAACYDTFDPIERQAEREAASTEKLWDFKLSQISAKLGGDSYTAAEVVSSLKKIKDLFNEDYNIVKWLANLYDPETGGFYYSNSARNSTGYLPDLESTSQALGLIESILTGYGGTLVDYLGEDIAASFVSFAKNMQDQNGYFYHPQWSRESVEGNAAKKSRDLINALNILSLFDASPTYDTPNGVKGEGAVTPTSCLTLPLRESCVSAVSSVVSVSDTDEIYIPTHLKSKSAFETYLATLDIRNSTVDVCETIYSELQLYIAVDEILAEENASYRLCDILIGYVNKYQNKNTGLWSSTSEITYEEVSEITSVMKIYSGLGKAIENYEELITSIMTCLSFEDEVDAITDISETWSALASVVSNITTYTHSIYKDEIDGVVSWICSNISPVLSATCDKLLLFIREDGSFSTTTEGSAYEVLGVQVAVPSTLEGDMNATLLATKNTWLAIFNVIGIGSVPLFNSSDRMMFQKTLLDMGIIIKNEVKKTDPLTFEGLPLGSTSEVKTSISSNSKAEIVASDEEHGNVLRIYSAEEGGSDQFSFDKVSAVTNPRCFSYEFDMCVLPETSEGIFTNIYIYQDVYMISLNRSGDTISFCEESSRSSSYTYTQDIGIRAEVGEWFNLRVEYYTGTAETVRIKIYFNGVCVAVTDNYFGSSKLNGVGIPATSCKTLAFYGMSSKVMDVLVDDLLFETTYQTYTPETDTTLNRNIDTADKAQKIHDFESTPVGTAPQDFTVSGSSSGISVTIDEDNNKLLSINQSVGEVILPLDQRGTGVNSAIIEFDLTVSSSSASGAIYQINFNEYMYKERSFGAMQILVRDGNAYLAEVVSGSTGTVYTETPIALGVKYRLKLHIFFEEGAMIVSLDNEIVGINTNILSGAKRFYMGETTIESKSSAASTLLIDNLVAERVKSSFEEMTAPSIDRKTYTFDDEDSLDFAGVSPSSGVLSYADAIGAEAYVKIPVNVRVNVPTMALISLDIAKVGEEDGEIVLFLTDKSNNKIAAFSVLTTDDGFEIYEYTQNGRYQVPMHTEANTSITLSIEYSAEKENFNLLVNGEYVAATSLIYQEGSADYEFEYLRISSFGASGITVDNIYAEQICGIFKTHSVSMVNTDSTQSVITYETSSFASLPSIMELIYGDASTSFKIRESKIKDKVTKVFEVDTGTAGATMVFIKRTQTTAGTNAAFFETDLMIKHTGSKMQLNLELQSVSATAYTISFTLDEAGGNLKLLAGSTSGADFTTELDVKDGEWFKVRIEYRDTPYDFDYDENIDCVTKIYINDEYVGEGHRPTTLGTVYEASTINRIRIRNVTGRYGKFYLDNSALGQCNLDYIAPVPADKETITYEPGVITAKTQFTLNSDSSTAEIIEMTDVAGQTTKVLKFYTALNSADKLTIVPTLTNSEANAVTFETDLMIEPKTETATFTLEPMTAGGNLPFSLTITAKAGGEVTISSADIPETVIGNSGEWIHLKVDYMNPRVDYTGDRRDDILCKIYIGDSTDPVAIGYQPYKTNGYYEPINLKKYVITTGSDSEAEIILDNTRFWQVVLTPDEVPAGGGSGDVFIEDPETDIFDNSGWV